MTVIRPIQPNWRDRSDFVRHINKLAASVLRQLHNKQTVTETDLILNQFDG